MESGHTEHHSEDQNSYDAAVNDASHNPAKGAVTHRKTENEEVLDLIFGEDNPLKARFLRALDKKPQLHDAAGAEEPAAGVDDKDPADAAEDNPAAECAEDSDITAEEEANPEVQASSEAELESPAEEHVGEHSADESDEEADSTTDGDDTSADGEDVAEGEGSSSDGEDADGEDVAEGEGSSSDGEGADGGDVAEGEDSSSDGENAAEGDDANANGEDVIEGDDPSFDTEEPAEKDDDSDNVVAFVDKLKTPTRAYSFAKHSADGAAKSQQEANLENKADDKAQDEPGESLYKPEERMIVAPNSSVQEVTQGVGKFVPVAQMLPARTDSRRRDRRRREIPPQFVGNDVPKIQGEPKHVVDSNVAPEKVEEKMTEQPQPTAITVDREKSKLDDILGLLGSLDELISAQKAENK